MKDVPEGSVEFYAMRGEDAGSNFKINKASSMSTSNLAWRLVLLLLRHSVRLILNLRRVMSQRMRARLLENKHRGETEEILHLLARHQVASARNQNKMPICDTLVRIL